MECSDPYFFLLFNNISIPSYSEFHEKPFDPTTVFKPSHDSPLLIPRTVKSSEEPMIRTKPLKKLPYAPNLVHMQLTPARHSNADVRSSSGPAFHCDFPDCDKTFTRPYNLKSHRRTHTLERPFVCPLCPKSFARQHDRNRHAKLHLGIKPFSCQFCTKSFARHDALNRHQRLVFGVPSCSNRKKSTGST